MGPSSGFTSASRTHGSRPARAAVWAVLCLGTVGAVLWAGSRWLWYEDTVPPARAAAPADPRLTYKGPYRNIRPEVKYVGDAACAGCHRTETDGFHRHPMSRSIVPISALAAAQRYDSKVHNPFEALGSRFTVERRGDRVWQKQERLGPKGKVLAVREVEVSHAIGSGRRGHSYFTSRDSFLFQTPVSWFGQKNIWDLSPGFHRAYLRTVGPACLSCHAGSVRPVEHAENRYAEPIFLQAAIGCERCHGPGEAHVRARKAEEAIKGRIDFTIVNPRHLTPELREAVCQQCHLEGAVRVLRRGRGDFDFRPGLPLQDFWRVYVAAEGLDRKQRAVSQVEQMHASKCFQASKGKLGCATCHDPHDAAPGPAARAAFHRRKCLSCHQQEHPCSLDRAARLKLSKQDSCIECHMARLRSDDIAHTATTDHSIPRRPARVARDGGKPRRGLPEDPLLPFHKASRGEDTDRDLAVALARLIREKGGVYQAYLTRARRLLTKAAEQYPDDIALLDGLGTVLDLEGQKAKALVQFEAILAIAPRHVRALRMAALIAGLLKKWDAALGYWKKVAVETPFDPEAHFYLALLLARARDDEQALAATGKLLALDPMRAEGLLIRSHCLARLGRKAEAEAARKKAEALATSTFEPFRRQFARFVEE